MRRMIALLTAVFVVCGASLSVSAEAPPQTVSSHSIVLYEPESGRVLMLPTATITYRPSS